MDYIFQFLVGTTDFITFYRGYTTQCTLKDLKSKTLKKVVIESISDTIKTILIILIIDQLANILDFILPTIVVALISLPFKMVFYTDNILRQTVHIGKLASLSFQVLTEVLKRDDMLIFELENQQKNLNFQSQINLVLRALLFTMILLVQTTIVDIVFLLLPKYIALINYLLYGVYISVGLISLKIQYQDHFPYYLHNHISYLAGFSAPLSIFLNLFTAFPYLGLYLALIVPFLQLQIMRIEPPELEQFKDLSFSEFQNILIQELLGKEQMNFKRQSYYEHLKQLNKDVIYKQNSKDALGWFGIPKLFRPHLLKYVGPTIKGLLEIRNKIFKTL